MAYIPKLFRQSELLKGDKNALSTLSRLIPAKNHLDTLKFFYSLEKTEQIFFLYEEDKIAELLSLIYIIRDNISLDEMIETLYNYDKLYSVWVNNHTGIPLEVILEKSTSLKRVCACVYRDNAFILLKKGTIVFLNRTGEEKNHAMTVFLEQTNVKKICSSSNFLVSLDKDGNVKVLSANNIIERAVCCTNNAVAVLLETGMVFAVDTDKVVPSINSDIVKMVSSKSHFACIRQNGSLEIYTDYTNNGVRIYHTFKEIDCVAKDVSCGTLFTICCTENGNIRFINARQDAEFRSNEQIKNVSANGTTFITLSINGSVSIINSLSMKTFKVNGKRFKKISCGTTNHIGIDDNQIFCIGKNLRLLESQNTNTYKHNERYNQISSLITENSRFKIFSQDSYNIILTDGPQVYVLYEGEQTTFNF